MRINKRLIQASPKRQPGDLERELIYLREIKNLRFWDNYAKTTFESIRHPEPCKSFHLLPDWEISKDMTFADLLHLRDELLKNIKICEQMIAKESTIGQLPEFPKLQRFKKDLL